MIELNRINGECEESFIWRIGRAKDSGQLDLSWEEIAKIINREFREDESEYYNESAYRKPYQQAKRYYEAGVFSDLTSEQYLELLRYEKQEVKKERQKLSDERTDYQKSLREEARKESFIELIERAMAKDIEPLDYKPCAQIDTDNDMIVCLSDIHAGIEVDNNWNTYNTGILKERLHKYIDEIKKIQNTHHCRRCELVLGGDSISGLIHPNLRLQNNENVIEQIKIVVNYVSDFIMALQDSFAEVRVHSVSGNHSRISPNKEDHLGGEELDSLVPFCLNIKFENYPNITIYEDKRIDNTIDSFVTRGGKLFYLVHGDKDTPNNILKNLTLMTGVKPDAIMMGHRHHNAFDTQYDVKIIQMGSVVGTDDYCVDKRIFSAPEQCVVITNNEKAVECIYDVPLK